MPLGGIVGDFVGARFERHNIHRTDFSWNSKWNRFTDDTVLTLATCSAVIDAVSYLSAYRGAVQRFPNVGYGPTFQAFVNNHRVSGVPNSPGNGAAMRVSPIGWALDDVDAVLAEARRSAVVSHNHPDAIAGAQAVAGAVCLLRQGAGIAEACTLAAQLTLDVTRPISYWRGRRWSALARDTVPVAFAALREGHDYASAVRLAISAGGDSDTIACMTGAMAEAKWGISDELAQQALKTLAKDAPGLCALLCRFQERFQIHPARVKP